VQSHRFTIVLTAVLACATPGAWCQAHWNQFRGPNGQGVAPDDLPLPTVFDRERNLMWKCDVGGGISSPCVFGDRIVVTSYESNELRTVCVARETGQVLWTRSVAAEQLERTHEINTPASSTATTDGERVYVYFGSFGLLAYDLDGHEVWRRELPVANNTFGTAASLIVAEGMLIFKSDTNGASSLEAIDGESGETIWATERTGFESGWSTPTLWRRDGVDELVVYGVWWVTAYDLADGSERWSVPGLSDEPIVTPTLGDGLVFVSSYNMNRNTEVLGLPPFETLLVECDADGDGKLSRDEAATNRSILSRADADGEGDHPLRMFFGFLDVDRDGFIVEGEWGKIFDWLGAFEHANAVVAIRPGAGDAPAEIAWEQPQGVPECPSPLYHDGRVYLVKNGGLVSCLDARTGEQKYQERLGSRGPCYASPVIGDGKIYSASARGVVTVFAVGDELRVLARNDLGERISATPALLGGRVYVRTDGGLYAFGEVADAKPAGDEG